jgi:hypothetical protein
VGLLSGCRCDARPPAGGLDLRPGEPASDALVRDESPALIPAARCGECHGKMEGEWRQSAHARAATSSLYVRMREEAQSPLCDRCHAPLRALAERDPVAADSVTCDVCHTLSAAALRPAVLAPLPLHPEDSRRYGPLCDTKPHYFHSMGCSPLHRESALCATCHDWTQTLPGGVQLAILPQYQEWLRSPAATAGVECQGCHMPSVRAEVAIGSAERSSVRGHGFDRAALLGKALRATALLRSAGAHAKLAIALENIGAGHAVPSGLPERRILVGVEVLDERGQVTAQQEHSLGRLWVDADGNEAPFYRAVAERSDTRIAAGASRSEEFELLLPSQGSLSLYVRWLARSPRLAQRLRVPASAPRPMLSARVVLPPAGKRPSELRLELAP